MLQDPLQDNTVGQNTHTKKYTYIYFITKRCNLVHVSTRFTFKTVVTGESDVVNFKIDIEYYCDPILR